MLIMLINGKIMQPVRSVPGLIIC